MTAKTSERKNSRTSTNSICHNTKSPKIIFYLASLDSSSIALFPWSLDSHKSRAEKSALRARLRPPSQCQTWKVEYRWLPSVGQQYLQLLYCLPQNHSAHPRRLLKSQNLTMSLSASIWSHCIQPSSKPLASIGGCIKRQSVCLLWVSISIHLHGTIRVSLANGTFADCLPRPYEPSRAFCQNRPFSSDTCWRNRASSQPAHFCYICKHHPGTA